MKKITFISILSFLCLISSAQKNEKEIKLISVINYSDSTVFREKYELDLKSKKIFYITPVANYLDIKNVKYRTPIHIDKSDWLQIITLINNIDFNKLDTVIDRNSNISQYEIEILNKKEENLIYAVRDESEVENLKRIFWIIRKNKCC